MAVTKIAFIDSIISKSDIKDEIDQRRYDKNKFVLSNIKGCSIYKYRNLNEKTVETMCDDMRWAYFSLIITHVPYSEEKLKYAQLCYRTNRYDIYLKDKPFLMFKQYEDSLNLIKYIKDKSAGIPILAYTGASNKDLPVKTLKEYGVDFISRREGYDYEIDASRYINNILDNIVNEN